MKSLIQLKNVASAIFLITSLFIASTAFAVTSSHSSNTGTGTGASTGSSSSSTVCQNGNEHPMNGECQCPKGMSVMGGSCACVNGNTKPSQAADGSPNCNCPSGFTVTGGVCTCSSSETASCTCPTGMTLSSTGVCE